MKQHLVTAALVLAASSSAAPEVTGGVRAGVYEDDDRTEVVRMLATIQAALSRWRLSAMQFQVAPDAHAQMATVLEITEGSTFAGAGPGSAGAGCGCH